MAYTMANIAALPYRYTNRKAPQYKAGHFHGFHSAVCTETVDRVSADGNSSAPELVPVWIGTGALTD